MRSRPHRRHLPLAPFLAAVTPMLCMAALQWAVLTRGDSARLAGLSHPALLLTLGWALTAALAAAGVALVQLRIRSAALAAAEARAHHGEARYRLQYEGSPRAAWVYDAETLRFLSVNPAAVRVYGWSESEFLERTILDVRPPEERDEMLRRVADGVRAVGPLARESVHVTRDGRRLEVSTLEQALTYNGRPAHLVLVEDATQQRRIERERAEAHARTLDQEATLSLALQTAQMGWWSWRHADRAPVWSPALAQLYGRPAGWQPADRAEVHAHVHPDDRADVLAVVEHAKLNGASHFACEFRVVHPDGTVRRLAARADLQRDEHGTVVRQLGVVRDVTDARAQLERAAASEQRIRAIFAHSPVAMLVADAATRRVTASNRAADALFGFTAADWPTLGPLGLVAPSARDAFVAAHAGRALTERITEEWPLMARDGRTFTARVTLEPVSLDDGPSLLVAVQDVTRERDALRTARESETRLREVIEALDEGVLLYTDTGLLLWNRAASRLLQLNATQLARQAPTPDGWTLYSNEGLPIPFEDSAPMRALAGGQRETDGVLRLERPDGARTYLVGSSIPISSTTEGGRAVVSTLRDVTVSQVAAQALAESEARFRGILENLRAVAVCLDLEGCVTFANPYTFELSGWGEDEVLGEEWFARFLVDPALGAATFGEAMASTTGSVHVESKLRTRTGAEHLLSWHVQPLHDAHGRVTGVAALGQDITEQRAAEAALRTLSERDALTGLLNRRGFESSVASVMERAHAGGPRQALLTLDLDGFKGINDVYGHAAGDEALREVARLLEDVVRGTDLAGRLGGDEFVVYLAGLRQPGDLTRVQERLQSVLDAHNEAAAAAGRPYRIAWSVGATLREPGDDLASMLARGDAGLYAHKHARRGRAVSAH